MPPASDSEPHPSRDDRRRHERHDIELAITFVCDRTKSTHRGTIRNIGMGGVLLETTARLSRLEPITLTLPAGRTGQASVPAVVVRYHLDTSFGIAFVSLSREDEQRVRNLIEHHRILRDHGRSARGLTEP